MSKRDYDAELENAMDKRIKLERRLRELNRKIAELETHVIVQRCKVVPVTTLLGYMGVEENWTPKGNAGEYGYNVCELAMGGQLEDWEEDYVCVAQDADPSAFVYMEYYEFPTFGLLGDITICHECFVYQRDAIVGAFRHYLEQVCGEDRWREETCLVDTYKMKGGEEKP